MKIIFLGSDNFAIPSLHLLCGSAHEIAAVVTQPDKPSGRGRNTKPCPVADIARGLNLKLLQPKKIGETHCIEELSSLGAKLLVVVAYGQFLPSRLLLSIPLGGVNLHPSLLPQYRGASPIQYAILNGDKKTGVTTLTITDTMDAGDIYLQRETEITRTETAETLQDRLSVLGAKLLLETIDRLEKGNLQLKPQDPSKIVFTRKLTKEMGHLNWDENVEVLYNKVRALNPWPGTYCFHDNKRLKILKASPLSMESKEESGTLIDLKGGMIVACGQGSLSLLEVQLEGKRKMSALEFMRGHPVPIGIRLK